MELIERDFRCPYSFRDCEKLLSISKYKNTTNRSSFMPIFTEIRDRIVQPKIILIRLLYLCYIKKE